jgi:hypothetical protein
MATLFFILAILLGIVAYKCYDKANRIENGSDGFHSQKKPVSSGQQEISHNSIEVKEFRPSASVVQDDDSAIEKVEHYTSWHDYQTKHPLRAKEIKSLGIDLSSKTDDDAAEWIFAIETTAHDSNCKISELKKKYFDGIEKHNPSDADWILMVPDLVEFSKKESQKYNLKISNTAADMMLLFILDKIKIIESKYANAPHLTKSDPMTLQMRFMLESNDDVLMLQKAHIYLKNYPMTVQNKAYRDNWHKQMMSLIDKRVSPYESLKGNPIAYKLAVSSEIYKLTHDEIQEDMQEGLVEEFNEHLLSFHEEMEIISEKASEKYKI